MVSKKPDGLFVFWRREGLVTASDAAGRLLASKMDAPAGLTAIVTDLPLGSGPTLYARLGDVFPWLCVALLFVLNARWLLAKYRKGDAAAWNLRAGSSGPGRS